VAGGEDEPQQIVADIVVQRGVEIRLRTGRFELVAQLLVLALEQLVAAPVIDRAVLGGGHEPGPGIPRNAGCRPLFERGEERVLREVLAEPDVTDHPGQRRDKLRRLDAPDGVDRAVDV
jgi:hypothetical protein